MKKLKYILPVLALGMLATSCSMDEEPKSSATIPMVFSSAKGLEAYANSFYNALPGVEDAMKGDATADYVSKMKVAGREIGAYTVNSSTSWSWGTLRNINFFLEHNVDPRVSEAVRNQYNGLARFWRAYFYFNKLQTYGEVPWIEKSFNDPNDPDLYNGRDTRDLIITKILEDLNFAIANIAEKKATANSNTINVWTAQLLKARVCLFEASWRKYHANDELDFARTGCKQYSANDLYKLAAEASDAVMKSGVYSLYTSKSYADGRGAYRELFISDKAVKQEVMLAIETDLTLRKGYNNWIFNSASYYDHLSMTRKFAKSYLNADGTPYTEFDADGNYKEFKAETTGRDLRLNQTIRGWDYTCKNNMGEYEITPAVFPNFTMSGYQFTKYVLDDVKVDNGANNYNDIPLMRYAEVLLINAEAKAELGTMTDADWAATIGKLRARAGITGGTAATGTLTAKPTAAEPYIAAYYPSVTDPCILEVRRERAIELCLEGFRMDDLVRWNCTDLFVNDPWEGVFVKALDTPIDMNGDGTYDVYFYDKGKGAAPKAYTAIALHIGTSSNNKVNVVKVNGGYLMKCNVGAGREWPAKQNLYPIPQIVINMNPNLTQNPGW